MEDEFIRVIAVLPAFSWAPPPDRNIDALYQPLREYTCVISNAARSSGWRAAVDTEDFFEMVERDGQNSNLISSEFYSASNSGSAVWENMHPKMKNL